VGNRLTDDMPRFLDPGMVPDEVRRHHASWLGRGDGSIIVVVVTDAPLLPHQLKRLAKRPALAIGRLGGVGAVGSGDIFLALSTANADVRESSGKSRAPVAVEMHPNLALTPVFEAAIDATEEAILNALVAGEAAEGANRLYVPRLPHGRVCELLRAHNLLRADSG
jgi:L-aminopeptidase/D-esterase-like protein